VQARLLLTSSGAGVSAGAQRRRERALLAAAELGETHLHLSTVAGEALSIGAFHLDPAPDDPRARATLWRRWSGGRAVACGAGFVVVTLGLPHRSSLVADDRRALRPEQVMNRCVRGLLAWLRRQGVDPVYPGLDSVTVDRRWLAHLGFAETRAGPTLFQAIVALDGSFATTPQLLDRLDPHGRIPARLVGADETTSLAACSARWRSTSHAQLDLDALATDIAQAYADGAQLEVAELDPAVTELLDTMTVDDVEMRPPPALDGAVTVTEAGVLGPVTASARVAGGRVAAFALSGDFLAPAWAVHELCTRLVDEPATAAAIAGVADSVLDGSDGYLLGLQPAALRTLLARAVSEPA
jgi:hypothetical protein